MTTMSLSPQSWIRLCKVGFALQLALVTVVGTLAYLGALPVLFVRVQRYDELCHAVLIGALAFFLDGVLRYRPLLRSRAQWLRLAPVLVLVVAAVEELAQALSPRRSASWSDFAADLAGVVVASWLSHWLGRRVTGRADRWVKPGSARAPAGPPGRDVAPRRA